jgi:hypothetical protein
MLQSSVENPASLNTFAQFFQLSLGMVSVYFYLIAIILQNKVLIVNSLQK